MATASTRTRTTRLDLDAGSATERADTLAVEEPLQLEVDGEQLTVTMRTPGHDVELALGFLHAEGLLRDAGDVVAMRHCTDVGPDGEPTYNLLQISARPGSRLAGDRVARPFTTTSACGVCGSASVEEVVARVPDPVHDDDVRVRADVLAGLPDALRAAQPTFDRTGGLHAAGLFSADGELLCVREDVGRHNAVDKVVGWGLREGRLPLRGTVLVVSGRASFELVQKAGGGRRPGPRRGLGAVLPRGVPRARGGHDAARLRAPAPRQRLRRRPPRGRRRHGPAGRRGTGVGPCPTSVLT